MAIEKISVIRGATTIERNEKDCIAARTRELIEDIVAKNGLNGGGRSLVSCILSSTSDITAFYPARAVRESGLLGCPLFSCLEPPIVGSLPLCLRVMIEVADEKHDLPVHHVYLHGAKALRPDLCKGFSVAIDGPSGAGKSTMAKRLSAKLAMTYLDTGAMYRAIGLKMHECGVSLDDIAAIEKTLADTKIDVTVKDGVQHVLTDGKDVSTEIRKHYVSKLASDFSAVKQVRLKLVEMQREIASKSDCILDGRDIGTYVLPNADVKFYLTASVHVRARRRYEELTAKGEKCDLKTIEADIVSRDYNDTHREFAPLRKADDAIEVVTDNMDIDQVVEFMSDIILKKR